MGRGRGRSRGRGRGSRGGHQEEGSDEEFDYKPERVGGQSATAGLLPPSDSEDESEESGEERQQPKQGQSARVGELPPSDSEEDSSSGEEDSDKDGDDPRKAAPVQAAPRRRKEDEVDPEQMRIDMERLALIRKKREEDRLKRIEQEGFDRFAPPSDGNKRPDALPSDHPSRKAAA